MRIRASLLIVVLFLAGCTSEVVSEPEKPILEPTKQAIDIIDYLLPLQNSEIRTEKPTHVVLHFISNVGNNAQDPYNLEDVYTIFLEYGVSTHYLIGRSGEIFQLVPDERVAYHAGSGVLPYFTKYRNKMNQYSIGIEMLAIGTKEEMESMIQEEIYNSINPAFIGYTDAQYKSLNILLEDIINRNPTIERSRTYIVGHDDYAPGRKTDPGHCLTGQRLVSKQYW
ncbi:N-acetylmuramoyl-L-alanine amidase [Lederbergia wuyishanensis]|uniref:N-acetylmuramoyl-L-alanine amidase n=1 Tax=Lederbergia wuyishanensis TaxID=1347903 RepID=A0ABU0D093_9BACI|nr:N-acetylmuramoyl-L-alanine amidase [Lederbergia wuyishanensis]MCJ8006436.1 N-acetylmuramoyl-L-alanine amidase [Lederbergia wuyishanensis]MDQ0341811.1 N-acetyl-anhydromuramyl-L-alanine amidase AmpD [Lederbergia wuyishanensis]